MKKTRLQSPVRAISFDVGGTLIEPWPSVGHVYAEVAARHGFTGLSAQDLSERFKMAWRSGPGFDYTRAGWRSLVDRTFQGLVSSCDPFFPELYDRFAEAEAWKVFDDVVMTLDQLASGGIRMAVISNWDERLRALLQCLRLHDYFETLVISCEVGFPKPSPVIFDHAASKLGLDPASILHIGDGFEMDYEGARQAGFQALHLRRGTKLLSDHESASLNELVSFLAVD
jgi:putative hydrolase of the HAD superfamily